MLVLLTALGAGFALAWTVRGSAGNQTPPAQELRAMLQSAGALIVYSEFGESADTLWAADSNDPSQRTQLGSVAHAPGFGIFPSVSPDGQRVAYTVATSDLSAELWVLDIDTRDSRRLAEGVDLRATPVWSPDGGGVVAARSSGTEGTPGHTELLLVDLSGNSKTLAAVDGGGAYAIEFSPDGAWLYYASITATGTDLHRAASSGGASEPVAHLSDGFARDFDLSPDGARLAYLAESPDTSAPFVTQVLDIASGAVERPRVAAAGAQFRPLWSSDGSLTVGTLEDGASAGGTRRVAVGGAAGATDEPIDAPARGFDVPLAWSPDDTRLAVRAFSEPSLSDPGTSTVVIVGTDGGRRQLSDLSDVAVAGWIEAGG
jgi:Tol biopolymer transport system component